MAVNKKSSSRQDIPIGITNVEKIKNDKLYGSVVRARGSTDAQKRKAKKDSERAKMTFDLPEDVKKAITNVAEKESVSKSNVVSLFLIYALSSYLEGKIHFGDYTIGCRSPRFENGMKLPKAPNFHIR